MKSVKDVLTEDNTATLQMTAKDLMDFADTIVEGVKVELKNIIANSGTEEKVTVLQAMGMLHKGRKTLWRWNKLGILKVHKEGRSVYYRKADIIDILNNGTGN